MNILHWWREDADYVKPFRVCSRLPTGDSTVRAKHAEVGRIYVHEARHGGLDSLKAARIRWDR
jgi:hypothetical protein